MSTITTTHLLPDGAERLRHKDLGWARLETIKSPAGAFSASFGTYAVVVTDSASIGPVSVNGVMASTPTYAPRSYSVFRPGDKVAGTFSEEVVYDRLVFEPGFVETTLKDEINRADIQLPPALRLDLTPVFASLWRNILAAIETPVAYSNAIAGVCGRVLLVLLVDAQLKNEAGNARSGRALAVKRAIAHIDANIGSNLEVYELANAAGLSMFHFCRVFKRETGLSVHQFVLERRLARARQMLLGTNEKIASIALECGFSSQSHLTTAFRKRYAVTPKSFRNTIGSRDK